MRDLLAFPLKREEVDSLVMQTLLRHLETDFLRKRREEPDVTYIDIEKPREYPREWRRGNLQLSNIDKNSTTTLIYHSLRRSLDYLHK